jgi:hypothetical protein
MKFFKKNTASQTQYSVPQYPPFVSVAGALESRLRTYRRFTWAVCGVCLSILALQQYRIGDMAEKLSRSEFLVVPGAADYMVVRPGVPPDEAIFTFANWAVDQIANFNYLDVERRFQFLAEHMSPEFREQFLMNFRKNMPRYREFTVTEIYQFQGINHYELKKLADRFSYVVTVRGNVSRYTGDQKLGPPAREVIRLTFQTSPVNRHKTFSFEITNLERMSEEDEEKINRAAKSIEESSK